VLKFLHCHRFFRPTLLKVLFEVIMGPRKELLVILILSTVLTKCCRMVAADETAVSFNVIGNTPHNINEENDLRTRLWTLGNQKDSQFLVHLGDSIRPESVCAQEEYAVVYSLLVQSSPFPVLAIPGDGDWANCGNSELAWKRWTQFFLNPPLEANWWAVSSIPNDIIRQEDKSENFSFVRSKVLFLGLHVLPQSSKDKIIETEWNKLVFKDIAWIQEITQERISIGNVDMASESNGVLGSGGLIRVVVIFGHSLPDQRILDVLYAEFHSSALQVVYIHSHGGEFGVEQPYASRGWSSFWTVQVGSGARGDFLKVSIRSDGIDNSWGSVNEDQLLLGDLIKLDGVTGAKGDTGTVAPLSNIAPTSSPTPLGPSFLDVHVTLELRSVRLLMSADVQMAFEAACELFLTDLYEYSAPPVLDITCQILEQTMLDERRRLDGGQMVHLGVNGGNMTQTETKNEQDQTALRVDLRVTGMIERHDAEFNFAEALVDFFNVLGGQFLSLFKGILAELGNANFESIRAVKAIKQIGTQENGSDEPRVGGNVGGAFIGGLSIALIVLGVVVVGALLSLFVLYRRQRRLVDKYAADGASSKASYKIRSGVLRSDNTTPPSSPLEPPSIVMHDEGVSDVDSMSRLQDFDSITEGNVWNMSTVTPDGDEDARTETSSPVSDDGRNISKLSRMDSCASIDASLPTLASGAPPSLASGSGGGGSISELSRGYSTVAYSGPAREFGHRRAYVRSASESSIDASVPTIASGAPPSLAGGTASVSQASQASMRGNSVGSRTALTFSSKSLTTPQRFTLTTRPVSMLTASSGGTLLVPFDEAPQVPPPKDRASSGGLGHGLVVTGRVDTNPPLAKFDKDREANQSSRHDWFNSMITDAVGENVMDGGSALAGGPISDPSSRNGGGHQAEEEAAGRRSALEKKRSRFFHFVRPEKKFLASNKTDKGRYAVEIAGTFASC